MDHLVLETIPRLRRPVGVVAFAGWNDAAGSATAAARFLVESFSATRFAYIEPEDFYNFSELRPHVRFADGGKKQREIVWPANECYYCELPELSRDVIVGVGIEPHYHWKTFSELLMRLFQECQISLVVSLGALLADVVHTKPVVVTGASGDPELQARLGMRSSRYEGPTGIVGVLHDCCLGHEIPTVSLWANVPHYISGLPNPKATLALVRRIMSLLDLSLDLTELEESTRGFESRLAEALAEDPKIAAYVKELEERLAEEEKISRESSDDLPTGKELVEELERFLRNRKRDPGQS